MMDRLTTHAKPLPQGTFSFCQICGERFSDICEVRLLQECDDKEVPEEGKYILIGQSCDGKRCWKKMEEHPRRYDEIPWGRGIPGLFILVCGTCPFRKEWTCTNPKLTTNGGEGLEMKIYRPFGNVHLNYGEDDSRSGWHSLDVIGECEGNPRILSPGE